MRERRIGTITMGVCLVVFGVLFLVHIFGGFLNYELIFHLWPLILIGLGMEILFTPVSHQAKQKNMILPRSL